MGQEHVHHDVDRVAHLTTRLREREEKAAYDLHMRDVGKMTVVLFVVGSLLVLLLTERPALVGLVAVICAAGYGLNFFNRPSVDSGKV